MLFVYVSVDLFSLYRADVRADIEAVEIFAFTIGQGFLLGVTIYILALSLMLFLSLVLPVRLTRTTNIVVAILYAVTVVRGAIGEWNYYILGSVPVRRRFRRAAVLTRPGAPRGSAIAWRPRTLPRRFE